LAPTIEQFFRLGRSAVIFFRSPGDFPAVFSLSVLDAEGHPTHARKSSFLPGAVIIFQLKQTSDGFARPGASGADVV
jgi:hypothetical protein